MTELKPLNPWRKTVRGVVQGIIAFAALSPLLFSVITNGSNATEATGYMASVLAVMAVITRLFNTPAVEIFLQSYIPWLAATAAKPGVITARDLCLLRSNAMCEAMVRVGAIYTRCGKRYVDVHHILPRSRGGTLLDAELELLHLICLCRNHHNWAHAHPQLAYEVGLTVDGQAVHESGKVIYTGSDQALLSEYGGDTSDEVRKLGQARRHQPARAGSVRLLHYGEAESP